MSLEPPLDYASEDDTTDYTPSTMTQAVIGGSIMLTIALAFYGAAMILQSLGATLAGLK